MGNFLENFTDSEIVEIVKGAGKELIDLGEKAGDAFLQFGGQSFR